MGEPEELEQLRGRFATIALAALLERPIVAADRNAAIKGRAADAYRIADAMMAARKKVSDHG